MSAMDFLHQIRLGSYQLALSVPGILKLCNYLQNVAAITYIFGLQLSTFLFYNKHARNKIIENEQLSDDEVNETRGKNNVNKFENEVAFARSYLVKAGYIDKSTYGVWSLTESGKTVEMTDELASEIFKNGIAFNVKSE